MTPENQSRLNAREQEIYELRHLLRQAMPPIPEDQLKPHIDLWPRLRARVESDQRADPTTSANRSSSTIRVPWFDWALAALAAVALLFFPRVIPALLYHF